MQLSNRTGSFYMLLSVACFSAMDIFVKLTTKHYPIGEVAFFRGLFGLIPIFFLSIANSVKSATIPQNQRNRLNQPKNEKKYNK
ncbi:MAG: hypothetical protein RL736_996, partial [Pseudomonadota bacterium]